MSLSVSPSARKRSTSACVTEERARRAAATWPMHGMSTRGSRWRLVSALSAGFQRGGVACSGVSVGSDTTVVRTRGLVKRYGELVAVDPVGLTGSAGEGYWALGTNGRGQKTVMRMVVGLIPAGVGGGGVFGPPGG